MKLPETVTTPLGEQPFGQAVLWHVPSMLRWIDDNRAARYMPSGDLVGVVLRRAAEMLERQST